MTQQHTIETRRLMLRPFVASDAAEVQRLAGERDIAATTLLIPHPYEDGMAEAWIDTHRNRLGADKEINYAVTLRSGRALVGSVGLKLNLPHENAELGYWIGKPYWGAGYATEAAEAVVRYGLETLALKRIHAHHLSGNLASGRVLAKLGMKREGTLRQHIKKWGVLGDAVLFGLLAEEFRPPEDRPYRVVSKEGAAD